MRQLTKEDLHRLILRQAALDRTALDWASTRPGVKGRLQLRIDEEVENRIVALVLGLLTYRNREQITRLLERLTSWPPVGSDRTLDLLTYWAGIGDKYFDFVETLYIKPTLFETWRRQMHSADEDLPALAWLSQNYIGTLRKRTIDPLVLLDQWPTFIRGNDPQLHRELAKGYGCLHLHLSGAYPAPYFWIGLMNRRFDDRPLLEKTTADLRGYRSIDELKALVELVKLARSARSKLWHYAKGRTGEALLDRTLDGCPFLTQPTEDQAVELGYLTDVAQEDVPNWQTATCPSLIGERYLLFRIIYIIPQLGDQRLAECLSRILWAYIVAKHAFLSAVQQAEGTAGFDYFEHTFRLVRWRGTDAESRCAEEIGDFLQESGSLVKLELMIAPRDNATDYKTDVAVASVISNRLEARQEPRTRELCGKPQVGLIVHFIKDQGEPLQERLTGDGNAYLAYHHRVRDRIARQGEQLLKHMRERPEDEVAICGIDAANRELYCPPEIFAELFRSAVPELRRRSSGRFRTIGRTFHVGEDFAHLCTGLRRVYEALEFLDLRPGDRLGHACALGLDPLRWIMTNPTIEMHLIDILDDAFFEAMLLRDRKRQRVDERRMSELMRRIDECCVEIFGDSVPFVQLERAWRKRAELTRNGATTFSDDGSVPQWVKVQHAKFARVEYESAGSHSLILQLRDAMPGVASLPADLAERIAAEYNYDIRTIRRFLKIKTVDTTPYVADLVELQALVAEEVSNRGIVIESNPSSNWLIGGLESHAEIPAVRWLSASPEKRLAYTINPDDPTVFASSIENEYFTVYAAAVHSVRSFSRVDCLREVAVLRERSLQASFLD